MVVAVVVVVAGTMTLFGVYSTLVSSLLTRVPPPRVAHLLFFWASPIVTICMLPLSESTINPFVICHVENIFLFFLFLLYSIDVYKRILSSPNPCAAAAAAAAHA